MSDQPEEERVRGWQVWKNPLWSRRGHPGGAEVPPENGNREVEGRADGPGKWFSAAVFSTGHAGELDV